MSDKNKRHISRMKKKKELIDERIASVNTKKGVMIILTGNGKGKSSSAFGMVGRALGHGMKVGVCQFIKSRTDTGEEAFFSKDPGVEWHVLGDGFTWDTQDLAQDIVTSESGWQVATDMLQDADFDLVVLDELTYLINYNYLDEELVLTVLRNRPRMQHIVVTGRGASNNLCEIADTVSEIADVKHAYRAGVSAQEGVDF